MNVGFQNLPSSWLEVSISLPVHGSVNHVTIDSTARSGSRNQGPAVNRYPRGNPWFVEVFHNDEREAFQFANEPRHQQFGASGRDTERFRPEVEQPPRGHGGILVCLEQSSRTVGRSGASVRTGAKARVDAD